MKKVHYCFLNALLVIFCSCNNSTVETQSDNTSENCIPYFTFDSIEHYYVEVDSNGVSDIEKKNGLSEIEKEQLHLMYEDTAKVLADAVMYQNLERINFIKTFVSAHKFDTINKIFCSRGLDEGWSSTCMPAYRDILIFKNRSKIIGIAKICFHCHESLIIGASDSTTSLNFRDGDNYIDDYNQLKEILYSK